MLPWFFKQKARFKSTILNIQMCVNCKYADLGETTTNGPLFLSLVISPDHSGQQVLRHWDASCASQDGSLTKHIPSLKLTVSTWKYAGTQEGNDRIPNIHPFSGAFAVSFWGFNNPGGAEPASGVRGFVMSNGLRHVSLILIIPIFRERNKLLPKSLLHLAVLVGYEMFHHGQFHQLIIKRITPIDYIISWYESTFCLHSSN